MQLMFVIIFDSTSSILKIKYRASSPWVRFSGITFIGLRYLQVCFFPSIYCFILLFYCLYEFQNCDQTREWVIPVRELLILVKNMAFLVMKRVRHILEYYL